MRARFSQTNISVSRKGIILVSVPLFFGLIFTAVLSVMLYRAEIQADIEAHSKEIIANTTSLVKASFDAFTALSAYALTKNAAFGERYDEIARQLPQDFKTLMKMVEGDPEKTKALKHIALIEEKAFIILNSAKGSLDDGDWDSGVMHIAAVRTNLEGLLQQLMSEVTEFIQKEKQLQSAGPATTLEWRNRLKVFLALGIAMNILLSLTLAVFFTKGITSRLAILMDNAARLARKEPLNERLQGTDEIAKLDDVFHNMAGVLAETEQRRQEIDHLRSQLVAMVSHDLRTPLSSIQGTLALIGREAFGKLSEKGKEMVGTAESETVRLITLINDLLDLEKMESGKLEISRSNISISDVIEQAADAVRVICESNGITVKTPVCGSKAYADGPRLVQVLVNLLSNAVKFSAAGSAIHISVHDEPDWLEVRVKDNGRGIPEEYQEKIFDKFQQVTAQDALQDGGSGLGLAICKALINEHGGVIGVESKVGQGSTFWFRIPRAPVALAEVGST